MGNLKEHLFNKWKCEFDAYDYHIDDSTLLKAIERVVTHLDKRQAPMIEAFNERWALERETL